MTESVLMFSRSTPHHQAGGMETLAWNLAAEWAALGTEVRVVTTEIPGAAQPFREDGVEVVPLPGTRPGRYSASWWEASRRYWTSLDAAPPVVLSVSAGAYSVVRARAHQPRTAFVMQAHGTSMLDIGSKLRDHDPRSLAGASKSSLSLLRDLARYRDFDRIVAVGDRVHESLTAPPQRWSVPVDRVCLIRNGVRGADHAFDARARAEVRGRLGIADHVTVVGCVGRLHVQKRFDRALRVAAALRDRGLADGFRFLLVGGGPDERRLRDMVGDLRLDGMVVFAGRAEPDRVRDYFSASDVALLTTSTLEVGLPLVVLEALASGLPCVIPPGPIRSPAISRVLEQVDPSDAALLADVLQKATPLPGPRASLLPPELDLRHCATEYLSLFRELASAPGSAAGM
ncbi:MAG TPA: glycosyltransferase family 4 protein [Micromonosporaceae bacterium]